MLEKETQKHIRLENLLWMLSESSFIESSIFDLESGFSIVESGFLKCKSEHESGFFPSPVFFGSESESKSESGPGFEVCRWLLGMYLLSYWPEIQPPFIFVWEFLNKIFRGEFSQCSQCYSIFWPWTLTSIADTANYMITRRKWPDMKT